MYHVSKYAGKGRLVSATSLRALQGPQPIKLPFIKRPLSIRLLPGPADAIDESDESKSRAGRPLPGLRQSNSAPYPPADGADRRDQRQRAGRAPAHEPAADLLAPAHAAGGRGDQDPAGGAA